MSVPADYTSPAGQVRLLIADVDPDRQVINDDRLDGFLALNSDNVRRAAADALDAIAVSELLVGKVIRTQDLQTDGAKLAAELRVRAAALRAQADDEDGGLTGGTFFAVDAPPDGCGPELAHWWP